MGYLKEMDKKSYAYSLNNDMKEFIEFLKRYKIISILKKQYIKDSNSDEDLNFLNNLDKNLSQLNEKRNNNLDNVAYLYEQEVSYNQRKKLGEIYTPCEIVNEILDGVGFCDNNCDGSKSIIDISCGAGSFLVQVVKRIINYRNKYSKNLNLARLKDLVDLIKLKVFGIDINPVACIICQINILYALFEILEKILNKDSTYQIPVFHIENKNIFTYSFNQKYDFIVGNPPYLFIREIPQDQKELIESRDFETSQGQYDYYQLFIEIGIKLLKSKGSLGFIVPDSILALSNRHFIRKYIYDHTLIREISYLGPQFEEPVVSNIILILQKESDAKERENHLIEIKLRRNSTTVTNSILQKYFREWNYKFLINLNQQDIEILEYLNKDFPKLNHLMDDHNYEIYLKRGVELTKEGKVIFCQRCKKYYPFPKGKLVCKSCNNLLTKNAIENIIVDQKPQDQKNDYALFIYSINRYKIKLIKYIILSKPGINYKSSEIYKNRIIIRQLNQNNLICATYSKNGYTSQSLYNLGIVSSPLREFNNLYLLGLINSELLSFYFFKSFGSYKNLYPRILIEKIKDLPIKVPQNENEKTLSNTIVKYINAVLKLIETDPSVSDNYQIKINQLIYELYNINDEQRDYIKNSLHQV